MIVQAFITNYVRGQISDLVADYRWDNDRILAYINEGRREIIRSHPEARYVSSILVGAMTDVAVGDDIGLGEDYNLALSHFVCHRILGEDSEDASNKTLSTWHLQAFEGAMK
jgi:hypothetical protein